MQRLMIVSGVSACLSVWFIAKGVAAPSAVFNAGGGAAKTSTFAVYEGGSQAESDWRAAAGGNVPLESFESYNAVPTPFSGPSDQVRELLALGITFDSNVVNAYPGVYVNSSQAHTGVNQLANFGGGLSAFADYRIRPAFGKAIYALGFWQCDPQGDETMVAYDADETEVGRIVGRINNGSGNSFAGFVSLVPIMRIAVLGNEGDGWNHIDDLQVVSRAGCTGDLNGDGFVEDSDFVLFVAGYNILDCADPTMPPGCPADLNRDAFVDDSDFVIFVGAYNELLCP